MTMHKAIIFMTMCLVSSLALQRNNLLMVKRNDKVINYSSELKSRPKGYIVNRKSATESINLNESLDRSYACDLKISRPTNLKTTPLSCYFEKSSSCSSCKSGICPVDNRPCEANRDYMDHIYGARFVPKPKQVFQSYKYSQQSQMHMYATAPAVVPTVPERILTVAERRSRRQKLFLMSTWLEDLLPNPSQGRSWMFNSICDTVKITMRVGRFIVSFIMMLTSATTLSSPSEEQNHRDSTTHGADHL